MKKKKNRKKKKFERFRLKNKSNHSSQLHRCTSEKIREKYCTMIEFVKRCKIFLYNFFLFSIEMDFYVLVQLLILYIHRKQFLQYVIENITCKKYLYLQ